MQNQGESKVREGGACWEVTEGSLTRSVEPRTGGVRVEVQAWDGNPEVCLIAACGRWHDHAGVPPPQSGCGRAATGHTLGVGRASTCKEAEVRTRCKGTPANQ